MAIVSREGQTYAQGHTGESTEMPYLDSDVIDWIAVSTGSRVVARADENGKVRLG